VTLSILLGTLLIGAGVGFCSGAFGKGGAAISTPLLHAIGVPALVAVASPLPATIPSTLLASHRYARAGHIDRRVLRIGIWIGVPATVLGAICTRWIAGGTLIMATDILVLALGLRVLFGAAHADDEVEVAVPAAVRVAIVAGAVGIVSGLLGNSGGFLLAPLFVSVLAMPVHRAIGTSLALSAALAVPGTIVHAWLGHIDWSITLVFGLASVPFARLGAITGLKMRARSLTLAFGAGLTTLAGGLLLLAR
jgi:uncharacterized membrane protein YfcA